MRLATKSRLYGHRPFDGEGASLYLAAGVTDPGQNAIRYRNHRVDLPRTLGVLRTSKTNRVSSLAAPDDELTFDASAYADMAVRVQVRPYLDDVELEVVTGSKLIILDGDGDDVTGIRGSLVLLDAELRAGGGVILRTRYTPSSSGPQPVSFTASRTAGPTSPTAVTVSYLVDDAFYDFEFSGLSSASAYTFKVSGSDGTTSTDLLTGIVLTVDDEGPPAPTGSIVAA